MALNIVLEVLLLVDTPSFTFLEILPKKAKYQDKSHFDSNEVVLEIGANLKSL